jgi:hypothetical protein
VLRKLFSTWMARQVAQHGSVAAVVLGLVCNLLGVPLAGEQLSLLITAGSVVVYIYTQVRALWHPKAPPAALLLVGAMLLAPGHVRAEVHTVTLIPPSEKADNTPLDGGLLRTWRIQCGLGTASASVSGWVVNDEVAFPGTTKDYDFKPAGGWVCRAWVTTTYSCASMQNADGAWTFGSGGDEFGNDINVNGMDASGTARRLATVGGRTYAEAGPLNAATSWWLWGGVTMPWWSGPETAPTIGPNDAQLVPLAPPLCESPPSPDLLFTIPMNSTQKTTNAKPKGASISISRNSTTPTP